MLDEITQDVNQQAYRVARGDYAQARLLASISDFARRASDFHFRMDSYLESPWDVRREVGDLSRRAQNVSHRVTYAPLYPERYGLGNSAVDVLNRMQQVIHGADVEIPPSPVRHDEGLRWWEHRDVDRNGNGIPDREEFGRVPPNASELRRLSQDVD